MNIWDMLLWVLDKFGPRPTKPKPQPPTPPVPSGSIAEQLLAAHNHIRSEAGLDLLVLNPNLGKAAVDHAKWMASNHVLSHTGISNSRPDQRIYNSGYRPKSWGENIAMGFGSVKSVMTGWMNSSGHKKNILTAHFKDVGFGMTNNYWCAVFGTTNTFAPDTHYLSGPLDPTS